MSRLLRAGIRRYFTSKVFWISIIFTIISAMLMSGYVGLDIDLLFMQLVALAVLISLCVGRECDEGIFRNKIIVGHTKKAIFMSEMVLAVMASTVLFIVYAIVFLIGNKYIFTVMPVAAMIKCCIVMLLINIALVVICVIISSMVTKSIVALIINVALLFFMLLGTAIIELELNEPEYAVGYEGECMEFVYNVLPTGQLEECSTVINKYLEYPLENPWYKLAIKLDVFEQDVLTKEENTMLNINIIYSLGVIVILAGVGCVMFSKKDFK